MPRVIPSQQAASDIKKAADGDVETTNAFTGLEMQETLMGENSPFQRAESLGSGISTVKRFVQKICSPTRLAPPALLNRSQQTGSAVAFTQLLKSV